MAPRPRPGDAVAGDEEPYGTTPLPTAAGDGGAARLWLDASHLLAAAQQPQAQQIAGGLDAVAVLGSGAGASSIAGAGIAVNSQFVAYTLKNGLIRVLHRHSSLKALLRQHQGALVRDLQFFPEGDILATVATRGGGGGGGGGASGSCLVVWRLFETQTDIDGHALLEIRAPHAEIARVVWHPFNANQFWMLHRGPATAAARTVATLVESTRLETAPEDDADATTTGRQHPVCRVPEDGIVAGGAIQIAHDGEAGASLTDLSWSSRHMRHVLSTFSNGDIVLWDLKQLTKGAGASRAVSPAKLGTVRDHRPVSSCRFLPHDRHARAGVTAAAGESWTSCFITGSQCNQVVTVWSAFGPGSSGTPVKLQELNWERPSSHYLLSVCSGPAPATALSPPSCFLVWADCAQGSAFAVHVRSTWSAAGSGGAATPAKQALLVGCDYVVPFRTQSPTFSWSVQTVPTTDISEEDLNEQGSLVFDMKLFAYQATMVQALTLTSYMCLPPESSWMAGTQGVRVERLLEGSPSVHASDIGSIEDDNGVLQYDENYDIEDDDQDGHDSADEFEAPDASVLPLPSVGSKDTKVPTPSLVSNPFANWLGALASNSRSALPVPTAPASPGDPIILQEPPPQPSAAPRNVSPPPLLASPEFLSPMDILKGAEASAVAPSAELAETSQDTASTNKEGPKKSTKPTSGAQPQILKNDDITHPMAPTSSSKASSVQVGNTAKIISSEDLRQMVRQEIQTCIAEQLQLVQETTNKSSSAMKDLQGSLRRLQVDTNAQAATVATKVEASLQGVFADCIRTVMIPSLESITNQILVKVSDHIDKVGLQKSAADNELAAVAKQLVAVTQLVVKLTEEVTSLRNAVTQQQQEASPPPLPATKAPAIDSTEKVKNDIVAALQAKKYADAFTKAVSASTAEIALFCCASADINEVLGGATPELSQMILLCLMQQLGTFLSSKNTTSDLQLELKWLQEIALSLSPSDPMIAKHVPSVLQQLVSGVNTRMAQNDPALRRPLQRLLQIIRGMQVTQA